jgi:membrane associated rhomboid family serine protease
LFPLKDNIPTLRFPLVTLVLIAINVAAYFLWQRGTFGDQTHFECNLYEFGFIPRELSDGGQISRQGCPNPDAPTWLTILTAMFMHGGLLHLGGNMLFLWIFGNNVEDSMGRFRFIVFYLLGGFAATALQFAFGADSVVPTIGASGAIAGVLGGYIILFPRARVITMILIVFFFTFVELPAIALLGFWFLQQALFGYFELTGSSGDGGVAYFAHVGGFVFGLAAIRLFADARKTTAQLQAGH